MERYFVCQAMFSKPMGCYFSPASLERTEQAALKAKNELIKQFLGDASLAARHIGKKIEDVYYLREGEGNGIFHSVYVPFDRDNYKTHGFYIIRQDWKDIDGCGQFFLDFSSPTMLSSSPVCKNYHSSYHAFLAKVMDEMEAGLDLGGHLNTQPPADPSKYPKQVVGCADIGSSFYRFVQMSTDVEMRYEDEELEQMLKG